MGVGSDDRLPVQDSDESDNVGSSRHEAKQLELASTASRVAGDRDCRPLDALL